MENSKPIKPLMTINYFSHQGGQREQMLNFIKVLKVGETAVIPCRNMELAVELLNRLKERFTDFDSYMQGSSSSNTVSDRTTEVLVDCNIIIERKV